MIVLKYSSFVYKIRLYFKTKVVNHDTLKPCHGQVPKWIQHGRLKNPSGFPGARLQKWSMSYLQKRHNNGEDNMMTYYEYLEAWFRLDGISLMRSQAKQLGTYPCQECQRQDESFRLKYHDRYNQQTQEMKPKTAEVTS